MAADQQTRKFTAVVKDAIHCKRFALAVQELNSRSSLLDLCFVCAHGIKVKAHKLLFCSVSSFLKKVFQDLPICVQDNIYIHVPDIESRTMNLLVDFLYEGSVRVGENDFNNFEAAKKALGIVLKNNSENNTSPVRAANPPAPLATPGQVMYIPTTPDSQGQMQYIMATQSSPMMMQENMSPMVQSSTQPVLMAQPNGQMIHVPTSQVQQNIIMQQSNNQVVPMVTGNQMVSGGQLVQCPRPNNQPLMMNSSQNNQPVMMNSNQNQPVMMENSQAQTMMMNNSQNQPVMMNPSQNQPIMMNNSQNQQIMMNNSQNQQMMMNNCQMQQVGNNSYMTSQSVQQQPQYVMSSNNSQVGQIQPQYVMSSSSNQLQTSRQYNRPQATAQTQRAHPQTAIRSRFTPQQHPGPVRATNANPRGRRVSRGSVSPGQNRASVVTNRIIQRSRNIVQ